MSKLPAHTNEGNRGLHPFLAAAGLSCLSACVRVRVFYKHSFYTSATPPRESASGDLA